MNKKTHSQYTKFGHSVSILLIATLLSGCDLFKKSEPLQDILRDSVVDSTGKLATPPQSVLLNTDYLLLYFSAHWCPPCKKFTPKLVEFYNTHNGGKDFRVVLISKDHTAEGMYSYMQKMNMPWQAIQFNSACAETLKETYSGDGIPRLVLVNQKGDVLADSFKDHVFIGPEHVLAELEKLLPKPIPELKKPTQPTKTAEPAAVITPQEIAKTPSAPTEPAIAEPESAEFKKLTKEYTLSGIGHASKGSIAIINNKIMPEGALLPNGAKVDKITNDYVDLILDGKRYRLYPKKLPTL